MCWQQYIAVATLFVAAAIGGFFLLSREAARASGTKDAIHLLSSAANIGPTDFNGNVGANAGGNGWALSNVGLQVTNNGGSQWSVVSPPIPTTSVESVFVAGSTDWVAGVENGVPVVDVSSDGGASWLPESLPNIGVQVGNVSLVGEGNSLVGLAYIQTTSSNFLVGGWMGYSNTSNSWKYSSTPFGGAVSDVNGKLWLVGGPTNSQLAVSSDQGDSWEVVALPAAVTGSALSVAGGFTDGSIALVATTPSQTNSDAYVVTLLSSTNSGSSWRTTYTTNETGSIGLGVASPSAVAGNSVWIGGIGTSTLMSISEAGQSTNSTFGSSGSSVQSLMNVGSTQPWVETVSSSCPTTKSSCADSSLLMIPGASGSGWQPTSFSDPTVGAL